MTGAPPVFLRCSYHSPCPFFSLLSNTQPFPLKTCPYSFMQALDSFPQAPVCCPWHLFRTRAIPREHCLSLAYLAMPEVLTWKFVSLLMKPPLDILEDLVQCTLLGFSRLHLIPGPSFQVFLLPLLSPSFSSFLHFFPSSKCFMASYSTLGTLKGLDHRSKWNRQGLLCTTCTFYRVKTDGKLLNKQADSPASNNGLMGSGCHEEWSVGTLHGH